jgi:hypothetical protein
MLRPRSSAYSAGDKNFCFAVNIFFGDGVSYNCRKLSAKGSNFLQ